MLLLIDNYDSFTYNLLHYLGELGAEIVVHRNDALSVDEALALKPQGIVLSPGPCDPDKAGICLDLLAKASETLPIFGLSIPSNILVPLWLIISVLPCMGLGARAIVPPKCWAMD